MCQCCQGGGRGWLGPTVNPEDVPMPYVYLYTDNGMPIYQCADCADFYDDGVVVSTKDHQAWHEEEDCGELHALAIQGCTWDDVPEQYQTHVPISDEDTTWARRFASTAESLTGHDPGRADWVKVTQKFVPCRSRGTHRSLGDCPLCTGDVIREDATEEEVLLPPHLRGPAIHPDEIARYVESKKHREAAPNA